MFHFFSSFWHHFCDRILTVPLQIAIIRNRTPHPDGGWVGDKKKKLLKVGYCVITNPNDGPDHEMVAEIYGKTAIEVLNTLIREEFISTLQHSGDMGIELCKAELALKNNLNYVQDKDLNLK